VSGSNAGANIEHQFKIIIIIIIIITDEQTLGKLISIITFQLENKAQASH